MGVPTNFGNDCSLGSQRIMVKSRGAIFFCYGQWITSEKMAAVSSVDTKIKKTL